MLIIMLFVETQLVVSQSVCDSVKVDSIVPQSVDTLAIDTIELADAEFEAWLDEYANVKEVADAAVRDTVEKRDFVELATKGEEARTREKNALIAGVLESFKKKVSDQSAQSAEPNSLVPVVAVDDSTQLNLLEQVDLALDAQRQTLLSDHNLLPL